MRQFHNGKIELHAGDCMEVLAKLPDNSIDAVVTDPPYHLTSIVKRFGGKNAAPVKVRLVEGQSGSPFARSARGFMGKQWDGGDIAFTPELWAEVLRVLKPGGHMVAFSGTRTYHRMVCAIEDAGFEIRDQLAWVYGSGFPKSHDVSKGIDKKHHLHEVAWFGKWLREERARRGISQKELAERGGFYDKVNHGGLVANWELGYSLPSPAEFNLVCDILQLEFNRIEELEREVIGKRKVNRGVAFTSEGPNSLEITLAATDAARQWQGWGTALKPAWEPICLARKPLSEGTVAANVLRWGTGAINIDACRVDGVPRTTHADGNRVTSEAASGHLNGKKPHGPIAAPSGRWPANLCHDGSPEVLAGFPDRDGAVSNGTGSTTWFAGKPTEQMPGYADSGSAARFFYTAKADADDRLRSKHPTVKPVDLMQWLVRMVCPKGGTVLDPFAGTGTTGAAAFIEGCRAVLIEREAEYLTDIERRMDLLLSGPDERARKLTEAEPYETLPLFS